LAIVLASASPRRRALIAHLGLPVEYREADVPEDPAPGERPAETALRLACEKVRKVAGPSPLPLGEGIGRSPEGETSSSPLPSREGSQGVRSVVVGGDTVVVADGRILGKPADDDEARAMLRDLRGREHQVITGVCLLDLASRCITTEAVETRVWMRDYSDEEIERYVRSGSPLDKAGAYGIQDESFHPVERIEGCYLNVVGLPLCAVARGLRTLGHEVPGYPPDGCGCGGL
jgi:MAF protein